LLFRFDYVLSSFHATFCLDEPKLSGGCVLARQSWRCRLRLGLNSILRAILYLRLPEPRVSHLSLRPPLFFIKHSRF
jgi:hypothetical protein